MNWGALFDYLGAGGGLLVAVNWIINFPVLRRKTRLDKDDMSRLIEEREDEFREKQHADKLEILIRLSELENILFLLVRCKHYDACPARYKLQEYKANLQYQRNRQPDLHQKGFRFPRDNPTESRGPDDSAG